MNLTNILARSTLILFIIGGASRAGKTLLAKKVAAKYGTGWFSTDFLSRPFEVTAPHLYVQDARDGVVNGKDFMLFAQKQWPFISELIKSIHAAKAHYVLEGEVFTPQLISQLGIETTPCFLGYASADPMIKLADIRKYSSTSSNDWTRAYTTEEQLCIINERIKFSRQIAAQAHTYNMPYFDVSKNFPSVLEQAYEAIV